MRVGDAHYDGTVHAFLDDSGDGGVKFDRGSSTHLVMAMVVFAQNDHLEATSRAIKRLQEQRRFRPGDEFKFARCKDRAKIEFFREVEPFNYAIRAIVIDKRRLWATWKSEAETVKHFAMRQLLTHHYGQLADVRLVIDGQDRRALEKPTSDALRDEVNAQTPGTIKRVSFADSRREVMLQMADMVAGSIHRAFRNDDKRSFEYLRLIKPKAVGPEGSIWVFGSK